VHNLPIREFTFVGATTDAQDILHTLKDRCNNLTFYLKDYSRDDLAQIFVNKFAAVGLTVEDAVLEQCINRCRSSIREVDSFVKGLKTKAIIQDVQIITVDMAEEYFRDIDRDAIGLKTKDIEILKAIRDEASGVISEDTLAARVHMDAKVMTKEFEPYLLKIGFVSISSRGRSLTEKGLAYVNAL
jgi:Holliday junction DNA helicase RuvB